MAIAADWLPGFNRAGALPPLSFGRGQGQSLRPPMPVSFGRGRGWAGAPPQDRFGPPATPIADTPWARVRGAVQAILGPSAPAAQAGSYLGGFDRGAGGGGGGGGMKDVSQGGGGGGGYAQPGAGYGGGGGGITPRYIGPPGQPPPFRAFANGGIVDRPTIGLLGENGPEAVVPLRGGGQTPPNRNRLKKDAYGNPVWDQSYDYGGWDPTGGGFYKTRPPGMAGSPGGAPPNWIGPPSRMPSGFGPNGERQGAADVAVQMGWITAEKAAELKKQAMAQLAAAYAAGTLDPMDKAMYEAALKGEFYTDPSSSWGPEEWNAEFERRNWENRNEPWMSQETPIDEWDPNTPPTPGWYTPPGPPVRMGSY